jgi:hypothetical protein
LSGNKVCLRPARLLSYLIAFVFAGKEDLHTAMSKPAGPAPTKDDAYDSFMREMENLL